MDFTTANTICLPALDLTPDHVLVGADRGTSRIYAGTPNSLLPGFVTVETEFGPLLLDDDRSVTYPVITGQRHTPGTPVAQANPADPVQPTRRSLWARLTHRHTTPTQ